MFSNIRVVVDVYIKEASMIESSLAKRNVPQSGRLTNFHLRVLTRYFSQVKHRMTVRPLVLCGPSGVGKSTLLKKLMAEFQDYFGFSVSHTTRSPRSGEQNGVHYHFVSKEDMRTAIQNGEFLETAEYSGNLYGTSKKAVEDVAKNNKICVLDIDMQGVVLIKETLLNPLYVFIQPPSIQDLEDRLTQRGTETAESLAKRLSAATEEINFGLTPGNFDLIITNDDAEQAYQRLRRFVLPLVESLRELSSD